MGLAARRSARQHNDIVMRFGACLMIMSLLVGLVMPPRKARAVVAVDDIAVVAGAFLGACGLKWILKDVDASGFTGAVHDQINNYLDTELGGMSIKDWVGGALIAATTDGGISISGTLARKLSAWADWLCIQRGISAGQTVTIQQGGQTMVVGGQTIRLSSYFLTDAGGYATRKAGVGTTFSVDSSEVPCTLLTFPSGVTFELRTYSSTKFYFGFWKGSNRLVMFSKPYSGCPSLSLALIDDGLCIVTEDVGLIDKTLYGTVQSHAPVSLADLGLTVTTVGDISISAATALDVPKTDEIEDDDVLILNPSLELAAGASLDDMLQEILNAILAGNLSVTKTITETQNPDVPGEVTDVDELGLPALGAALVSRFPFSIPWDLARGVKLLAAPAKAPYWELDFLAPISGRVGGWKGSTKVVIDMGEYPIIGQFCRWTSTIGFCLLLASGTKKLIWTA